MVASQKALMGAGEEGYMGLDASDKALQRLNQGIWYPRPALSTPPRVIVMAPTRVRESLPPTSGLPRLSTSLGLFVGNIF